MKSKIVLFLVTGIFSLQASSSEELKSFVTSNTKSVSQTKPDLGACWCPPIPGCGEPCQYNRSQEQAFKSLFPEGGPWDKPGNPIKKCLVNYMHKTTPYNCTIATAVPAAALAATTVGAGVGSVSICMGEFCCACPGGHNTCSHFLVEMCCPFACDASQALCCPPNVYNVLTMLAELGCMALPFACGSLECCCVNYLAKSENWSTDHSTTFPILELEDDFE